MLLYLFVFCIGAPELFSQGSRNLLLRNVKLIDMEGETEDAVVSILIIDKVVELVTKDEISVEEADVAYDASEGILLGKLETGNPAGFMIVGDDPRVNIRVILDTKSFTTFAIQQGEILLNILTRLYTDGGKAKERGWLAYSPPPLALPVSYADKTKWNRWESSWISGIFVGAIVLDRTRWISQDENNKEQVGDLSEYDGGEIRGLRFGVGGTFNFKQPWIYMIAGASNAFDKGFDTETANDITFFDYRLDIPLPANTTLSLGKQKEPISMERLIPLIFTPMHERTIAADAMLTARNVGILFNGTAFNQSMTWAAGVFNDWFDAGEAFDNRATQVIGRVTALLPVSEDESHVFHIGVGGRYTNAKQGVRYGRRPEFNMAPLFVDTEVLEAENAFTWVGELAWRRGPFWIESEYLGSYVQSEPNGSPYFDGYHVSANWAITGEMRGYNKRAGIFKQLPVARSVYNNGPGAWELSVRWSTLDLNDQLVNGGQIGIASVGLTWWLNPIFSFGFNYRHIRLDKKGLIGYSDGLNVRIFLSLE